ncbi:MAG: trans-sulfuration enzyme family protein [Clostridium sp.]|uniref:trans-sulfuration enzyme family protein n=1 Tax=Clostridium sp. TaxID=1506 RepID=UPI003F2D07D5
MKKRDSEICVGYGEDHSKYFGAVAPPIMQTSLFAFENWDEFLKGITAEREHYVYSRGVNPTTEILEAKLKELERGEKCKCFASGMAAISSTMFTLVKGNDHILMVNNVYGPAVAYAKELGKFGVQMTNIYVEDAREIEEHIKENTKLIYVESPSTMNMQILDLKEVARIAKERNIITAIDNTWSTPLNQKPIEMGIDLVLHSCTKYIGGHSDTVAGAVIGSYKLVDKIFEIGHQFGGGVISPFDAWLMIRGLRTLPQRLAYQQNSVKLFIEELKSQKRVKKINHPLCFEGKQKELFKEQMNGYSSLFSVEIDFENYEQVRNFMNSLKIFKLGVSWGGYESLAITPNYGNNEEALEASKINKNLVRLYVGLEDPELLIEDIRRGFESFDK